MISGRAAGPCREGVEPALAFAIGRGAGGRERILLRRRDALPSECPFLWYSIRAEPEPRGPFWRVLEVRSVEALPVTRVELIEALWRAMSPGCGVAAVESLARDLAFASDPLWSEDVPARQTAARDLAEDAWRSPAFLEMLPRLPANFLRALEPETELEFVRELWRAHPAIFAHRAAALRALSSGIAAEKLRAFEPSGVDDWSRAAEAAFRARGELAAPKPPPRASPYYHVTPDGVATEIGRARTQAALARAVAGLRELRLAQCSDYGDAFAARLRGLEAEGWTACAARPALELEFGSPPPSGVASLALVHAHKLGPELLLRFLEGGSVERLALIGDADEVPAHAEAGGGDLFRDLSAAFPAATERWVGGESVPAIASLRSRSVANLTATEASSEEDLDKIARRWVGARKRSWVVICSSEERRARIRRALGLGDARLGNRVHLPETDEVGALVRAISLETRKDVPKKGRLREDEEYEIHLDPGGGRPIARVEVSARDVEASDVTASYRWIGPRVDSVLFVAEASTSLDEIAGAAKYARAGNFALACAPGAMLADFPDRRPSRLSLMPRLLSPR